jgi:hypothetical protein
MSLLLRSTVTDPGVVICQLPCDELKVHIAPVTGGDVTPIDAVEPLMIDAQAES